MITQRHGEYVLRIGAHPPHDLLFAGEVTDESDVVGWRGFERTVEQLDELRVRISAALEEIGGKVGLLS